MAKFTDTLVDPVKEARRLRANKAKRWGRSILRRYHEEKIYAAREQQRKREIPEWMLRLARKGL